MPRAKELAWYKWFPFKARSSWRWNSLTIAEEGAFRRLYDIAAMANGPARRGELWFTETKPYADRDIARLLRIPINRWRKIRAKLVDTFELLKQRPSGIYYFPNFRKHQHQAGLRWRNDRPKTVPKPSQKCPNSRALARGRGRSRSRSINIPQTPAGNPPALSAEPTPVSVMEAWNQMAKKAYLPVVEKLTESRKKTVKARLSDPDWTKRFRRALEIIPHVPFFRGAGPRGWKANFDFFIQPNRVFKIIEEHGKTAPRRNEKAVKEAEDLATKWQVEKARAEQSREKVAKIDEAINTLPQEKREALTKEAIKAIKGRGVSYSIIKAAPLMVASEMRRLFREKGKAK